MIVTLGAERSSVISHILHAVAGRLAAPDRTARSNKRLPQPVLPPQGGMTHPPLERLDKSVGLAGGHRPSPPLPLLADMGLSGVLACAPRVSIP
eukprot:4701874-Pleurochrysis_carterae.AAC.4